MAASSAGPGRGSARRGRKPKSALSNEPVSGSMVASNNAARSEEDDEDSEAETSDFDNDETGQPQHQQQQQQHRKLHHDDDVFFSTGSHVLDKPTILSSGTVVRPGSILSTPHLPTLYPNVTSSNLYPAMPVKHDTGLTSHHFTTASQHQQQQSTKNLLLNPTFQSGLPSALAHQPQQQLPKLPGIPSQSLQQQFPQTAAHTRSAVAAAPPLFNIEQFMQHSPTAAGSTATTGGIDPRSLSSLMAGSPNGGSNSNSTLPYPLPNFNNTPNRQS
ncbi:hypothetical protein GQ42DRAFT_155951 [Ramicandelaber brevisporus]|nr:hypothetical protein GQ42DRAFT_155951 [Ramicandelaber brevisporus]